MPESKTAEELTRLIEEWEADPCWDLEETEGFEEYRGFLMRYSHSYWEKTRLERSAKITEFARAWGIEGNRRLAIELFDTQEIIHNLQERIEKLER